MRDVVKNGGIKATAVKSGITKDWTDERETLIGAEEIVGVGGLISGIDG